MKFGCYGSRACIVVTLFVLLLTSSSHAQTSSGTLRGRVTDPTGAVIPQASVTATGPSGKKATAVTDQQGAYELKGLSPGTYSVSTTAKGFHRINEAERRGLCRPVAAVRHLPRNSGRARKG